MSEPLVHKQEPSQPSQMLDHVGLFAPPSKFDEVIAWYTAAFAPLGYTKQHEYPGIAVGFGSAPNAAPFWIAKREGEPSPIHLAFKAKDHESVQRFHEEAVKAGGKDNGKPGIRQYHPNYYAAFVFDPVG